VRCLDVGRKAVYIYLKTMRKGKAVIYLLIDAEVKQDLEDYVAEQETSQRAVIEDLIRDKISKKRIPVEVE
jgi:hypothetical protein